MTALDPLESSLRAALEGQADEAMQQTDTTSEFTRFVAGGRGSRTPVAIGKGASVAAGLAAAVAVVAIVLVAGSVFSGPVVAHRHPSPYPPLQRVAAAVPLRPGAVTSSNRAAGTVAPELVVGRILWSVQNAGSNGSAYVLRSDARTLRVLSTVHFSTTFRHLRTTQLFRVGDTVVMPVQSVESSAGNDSRDAVLRFDAQTGKRLPQLDVRSTGVGVATPEGVFVQTDVSQLGLLDPTGNRVVRTISMPFVDEVVYSSGLLWGYDVATSHVVGIDPSNGSQKAAVPLPGTSSAVLVQAGS